MKRAPVLLLLVALLPALAGCGSSSSSSKTSSGTATSRTAAASQPSGGAAPAGTGVQVTIKSLAFNPSSVHAVVGETVVWTNLDGPPHNVTWMGGPKFTSSSTLNTNDKFSLRLTQAGTIHYICTIHPFMKATIVVTK